MGQVPGEGWCNLSGAKLPNCKWRQAVAGGVGPSHFWIFVSLRDADVLAGLDFRRVAAAGSRLRARRIAEIGTVAQFATFVTVSGTTGTPFATFTEPWPRRLAVLTA